MKKKILTSLILLFLSSCGYEAKYSKKNRDYYNFSISKLNFIGDREINLKIKEKLNNYTLTKKDKDFTLKVSSTVEKLILAKNDSGDPTNFKITIILNVEILNNNKLINNQILTENFNYNNNSNKFDLKRYEKRIKNNLATTLTDKLIFKISSIQ
tara:strand:- start:178 stop:642 length:465 start_codon:yes stop_codon:yes gene_type:complete